MMELETEIVQDHWPSIRLHFELLERVDMDIRSGSGSVLQPDHVNLTKSALVLHLYNVVEATMRRVCEVLALRASSSKMSEWEEAFLNTWVKSKLEGARDKVEPGKRVKEAVKMLESMAERGAIARANLGNIASGNWSDEQILYLAKQVNCPINMPDRIEAMAAKRHFSGKHNAFKYLRHVRNALSHGEQPFLDVMRDLPAAKLKDLARRIFIYMRYVCRCFDNFVKTRQYLRVEAR